MRTVALFLLAFCFVSVSALAGYEKASADIAKHGAAITVDRDHSPAKGEPTGADAEDSANVECPCKKTSGALTLACGITLALSNDDLGGWLSGTKQTWSAFARTDRDAQMMYLLKRPPRTIL